MYLQQRSLRFSLAKETISFLAILLVIFLLQRVGWSTLIHQKVELVSTPVASFFAASINFVEQPLFSFNTMFSSAKELADLKVQHAQTLAALAKMEQVEAENSQLRAMIENKHLAFEERTITSPILSYAYPAVAAGETQGVREGELVIIADTMVGRVVSVQSSQSRILLLNSVDAQPVLAQTESGYQGLLKGTGKGVVLTQLPPDAKLTVGERLVTVGQEGVRAGVFLGVIASENDPKTSPTKSVPVDQLVSFYSTALVELR